MMDRHKNDMGDFEKALSIVYDRGVESMVHLIKISFAAGYTQGHQDGIENIFNRDNSEKMFIENMHSHLTNND